MQRKSQSHIYALQGLYECLPLLPKDSRSPQMSLRHSKAPSRHFVLLQDFLCGQCHVTRQDIIHGRRNLALHSFQSFCGGFALVLLVQQSHHMASEPQLASSGIVASLLLGVRPLVVRQVPCWLCFLANERRRVGSVQGRDDFVGGGSYRDFKLSRHLGSSEFESLNSS